VTFRDVRATPLSVPEIAAIVQEFGDRVINKQSTTYRSFSDFLRMSEAEEQIAAQPTVMKRPVIHDGSKWYLGWDDAVQAALLG
jgi:arsenate reductase (glutaredoxin)